MTPIVVGCPVRAREWIVARWVDHVMKACIAANLHPSLVFVADLGDPTCDVIRGAAAAFELDVHWVPVVEDTFVDRRDWGPSRYTRMVDLRNQLLGEVRRLGSPLFLSLDSDILLHPGALACCVEDLDRFGAVAPALFMTATTRTPNAGKLNSQGKLMRNWTAGAVYGVDVIMAAKLMTPAAYNVDYVDHHGGEDLGWSAAARAAGVRLGFDSRTVSKHVLHSGLIDRVDRRCGY